MCIGLPLFCLALPVSQQDFQIQREDASDNQ